MSKKTIWIGVDVGKSFCVAAIDMPGIEGRCPRCKVTELPSFEFDNTLSGLKKMLRWADKLCKAYLTQNELAEDTVELRLIMESTGIYSRNLERFILETRPELQPVIENATILRSYRQSLNLKNETDFLDAKGIAYYGGDRQPEARQRSAVFYQTLAEMCRMRNFYSVQLTAYKNMHESLNEPMLKRMDTSVIQVLKTKIEELTSEIKKFVNEHEELRQQMNIMITMPGIAILSAAILLGELGSFKDFSSRNEIGAFCGLNPMRKDSGTSIRKSRLSKKGSALARKILYMNSTRAVQLDPYLKAFYDRLISNGKRPQTARCACMRKLLTILRSMVANNQPYNQQYFFQKKTEKTIKTA